MKQVIVLFLILYSGKSFSQELVTSTQYDAFIKRFNAKMDTVIWLCEYDRVAWITTDEVMETPKEEQAKLGSEWFCYEKDNMWYAVYGKFVNNKYEQGYHYSVDSTGVISRIYTEVDTVISHSYSRALQNSKRVYKSRRDSISVRFNSYVKRNSDGTITVWLLPAFTHDGIAVYGGEFIYTFDSLGNELLKRNEYLGIYRGIKPNRTKEFWLSYETVEEPTLGAVFFVWYYKGYFDRIVIDTKRFKSTVFHTDHKDYYWVHGSKED